MISIGTPDIFPGYPTNTGVIEAEPLSIPRIPNVGTVMAEVSQPQVGNHSKEFILSPELVLSIAEVVLSQKDLI